MEPAHQAKPIRASKWLKGSTAPPRIPVVYQRLSELLEMKTKPAAAKESFLEEEVGLKIWEVQGKGL